MPDLPTQQPNTFSPSQYLAAIREAYFYNDRSFGLEKRWLALDVAKDIERADPEQLHFTVDWHNEITFSPFKQETHQAVCVWQTREFLSTYKQHLLNKELSERERQQSYRYVELRDQLCKRIIRQFYSTGVTSGDREPIEKMVDKLIQSRSELVAKQFGINFKDLLQADRDLEETKRKKE